MTAQNASLSGELRIMFAQDESHSGYLDKFFADNPNFNISWINDLGKSRYAAAATALLNEAEQATNLEAKHVNHSRFSFATLTECSDLADAEYW